MKKAIRYALILCLLSWTIVTVAVFGFGLDRKANPLGYTVFATGYMFLPFIVALVLQAVDKEKFNHSGLVNFRLKWSWLIAWLLPIVLTFASILVNGLMPNVELGYGMEQVMNQANLPESQQDLVQKQLMSIPPAVMVVSNVVSALLAGATINAVAAFGEEYGWRNYLVNALRKKCFATVALFIGVVWGIWHFPLILMGHNYPNEPYWGVLLMVVFCILAGIIELYFVLKTKSVIVAAVFHGTINAIAGIVAIFVKGGNDFVNGMMGLSGFIVMGFTILILWLIDKYVTKDDIFAKTLGESLER